VARLSLVNPFEQAVVEHEAWVATFVRAVRDGGGELTVELVRQDNQCPLGVWLYGAGWHAVTNQTASHMLRDIHAEFHTAAAKVLSLALMGRSREAAAAMGEDTLYAQWSALLVDALSGYANATGS